MARDPRSEIRRAIDQGLRGEDLAKVIEQNWSDIAELPDDEETAFLQELTSDPEISEAYWKVASDPARNPDLKTGVAPILGGGPQILSRTTAEGVKEITAEGARAIGGASGTIGSTVQQAGAAASPLLKKAAQILFGKSFKGFATRAGLAGGIAAFQGLEEGRPEGELFGQPGAEGQRPTYQTTPSEMRGFSRPASVGPEQPTGPGQGQLPPDPGFNIMVVDHDGSITGTPGAVAVVSSADLGMQPDPTVTEIINQQNLASGSIAETLTQLISSGALAQTRQEQGRKVFQTIFPEGLGTIAVDVPTQVQGRTPPEQTARSGRTGVPESVRPGIGTPIGDITGTVDLPGGPTNVDAGPVNVPAGSRLAPRVFNRHRDRTLIEWANLAARQYDVPLNILYGLIDHESNWNPSAVGDNGNSFGLAQIYMPVWGSQVSKSAALNPVYALNWTARMLRERFNTYGRWDAAVAAHNSPVAANHLVKTGQFQNAKSKSYVNSVLGRANNSGLSSYIVDAGDLDAIPTAGGGGGPRVPAFTEPDPAKSREYARAIYQELLGREPNEAEMAKAVSRLKELARASYDAEVRALRGGTTQEVDIESQFEEGIRGSGEFEFHEEVTKQRSFTDYAAGIARLLQQGV